MKRTHRLRTLFLLSPKYPTFGWRSWLDASCPRSNYFSHHCPIYGFSFYSAAKPSLSHHLLTSHHIALYRLTSPLITSPHITHHTTHYTSHITHQTSYITYHIPQINRRLISLSSLVSKSIFNSRPLDLSVDEKSKILQNTCTVV